jgi:hypothetical protein
MGRIDGTNRVLNTFERLHFGCLFSLPLWTRSASADSWNEPRGVETTIHQVSTTPWAKVHGERRAGTTMRQVPDRRRYVKPNPCCVVSCLKGHKTRHVPYGEFFVFGRASRRDSATWQRKWGQEAYAADSDSSLCRECFPTWVFAG